MWQSIKVFEVLPPDYVTINQNFSPIPQIYTPDNTILTKNNFWKISQFSRKTYIVCKFWTKMVLLGFWSGTPSLCDNQLRFLRFYPLIMWQSIKISVLFHKSTHQTIPFWLKRISRKTYIVCKIWTKMVLQGFWGFTPWLCDNQSKFQSYSTNLHTEPYHFDRK